MSTNVTAARVSFGLNELNYQASSSPLVKFENGSAFYVQADGNLCYYISGGKCTWASLSNVGSGDARKLILRFQDDGNLVLYYDGKPEWTTDTEKKGNRLVVSDSTPYLTILDKIGNVAWYSKQEQE